MRIQTCFAGLALATCILSQAGCAVPQKPGRGSVMHQVEPTTQRGYWLYLPEDYVKNHGQRQDRGRWPVIVTFHGMNPWDTAGRQIRECQAEADRYGFLVIAPELDTSSSFMQYPLKDPNLPYVKRDERAVIAIMDEVFRRTNGDPTRVLSTSWSCGGYLAHYMVNRYPERFTCLAVRQSNFSEALLDVSHISKYRSMKIGIFFGENDLPACRKESIQAVEWYRSHGMYVEAKLVAGLGHERTPQTAAAFFASTIGASPKTPPDLGAIVLKDVTTVNGQFRTAASEDRSSPGSSAAPIRREPGAASGNVMFSPGGSPAVRNTVSVPPREPIRRAPTTLREVPGGAPTRRRPPTAPLYSTDSTP